MRRKRVIIVLAVCVLVGIGVVAFWPGEKEPEYNGKKLSEWLDGYQTGVAMESPTQEREAIKAIRTIGTNALPCLLNWVRRRDVPTWQVRAAEQCHRLGLDWLQRFVWSRKRQTKYAWAALRILGSNARGAIPEVTRIAVESQSSDVVLTALEFLSANGPDAVPALLKVIDRGKGERRGWSMHFIREMPNLGTNGPAVVATLLKCLQEQDEDAAASAALALGEVGLQTKEVVPALAAQLQDNRRMVRYSATRALGSLANDRSAIAELRKAVPELVNAQNDHDPMVREYATNALRKVAPEVLTNGITEVSH